MQGDYEAIGQARLAELHAKAAEQRQLREAADARPAPSFRLSVLWGLVKLEVWPRENTVGKGQLVAK